MRRLIATSELGNVKCGTGSEVVPKGVMSLRLDGLDYRLSQSNVEEELTRPKSSQVFKARLTAFDEQIGIPGCTSSKLGEANLHLQIDNEPWQRIGQSVLYRTQLPRRVEVTVVDPLICFNFGGAPGSLRLDLTDANNELWQFEGVALAQYAHSSGLLRVKLPPSAACFGFEPNLQIPIEGLGDSPDALFKSGYEIEEIYPDLVVTMSELPSALENVFRYRIEVANVAIGPAENIQVGDFYPKTGSPRFTDGMVNWSCGANGIGSSCGINPGGGGRVNLVNAALPGYKGFGPPPKLVIVVERTFVEYELGESFMVHAAATIVPPGFPDRQRANNSTTLPAEVSAPDGPLAADDHFATNQNTLILGNVYADNGFGIDEHAAGNPFWVARVNGSEAAVGVSVELLAAPGGGTPATVVVQSNGALNFNPGEAFIPVPAGGFGQIDFNYTLRDGDGMESTATVTVTVAGLNDPPVAGDIAFQMVPPGGGVPAPGALAASTDPDSDALAVVAVNGGAVFPGGTAFLLPSGATLVMYPDGSFTFTHFGVQPGQFDTFNITVSDGQFQSNAKVTINWVDE